MLHIITVIGLCNFLIRYGSCIPHGGTFIVLGGRNVEGDEYYEDSYTLTKNNEWVFMVYDAYGRISQSAVEYISKEKVIEYGCSELLD